MYLPKSETSYTGAQTTLVPAVSYVSVFNHPSIGIRVAQRCRMAKYRVQYPIHAYVGPFCDLQLAV